MRQTPTSAGEPVTRMLPRSLMVPPGIPDFMTRERIVERRPVRRSTGRAWSGWAPIERVEVSADGGATWARRASSATRPLGGARGAAGRCDWDAASRASTSSAAARRDAAGNAQPLEAAWNLGGYANNAVQRVPVTVA